MRAIPLSVTAATAVAAALVLTACSSGGGDGKETGNKNTDRTACRIGQVGVQVGPANAAPSAGDNGDVPVTITNRGAQCTLDGFPGVVLAAGGSTATVPADKAGTPQKLTLPKDGTATFTLSYVRGKDGDAASLPAKTLRLSLPGASDSQNFTWSYGPVQGKKDAKDPNASVTAFTQAGD
ncbi:DUF4232 domain-containing protein [Streptomyces tropicalis]|uniref:DUF4232 domain-containing protein n=1 Tax=Streptomyces tropicalis TaxID=3034234 RepID=A0ABT6A7M4_9ACTN|nr:DUF4232 domain-containing protein [Streptomyces tropicalis]MDF3300639.1 DUF4232 domain-containing protein [Streptomyces tropicalis]